MAQVTKPRLNVPPTAKRVSRAESGLVQSSDRHGRIPSATPSSTKGPLPTSITTLPSECPNGTKPTRAWLYA
ncbi:hypothetical protein COCC4DRAFT_150870 [Bipolaris maydis ATCC 48331]|uniref:Uncharacterized protein n=2 Tax=Cochliobolus heterostrophus TaxID=5016 RepID=M2SPJ4_COCH5|nr:uncharacterized protein COCC4DRAFT_150870 [Bipolaris maydis ATCC 48331]EMD87250.1 hypothetical protein COCHEDRAFT_1159559 [Bipolaris maydis C5]ENI00355.1 hypothetical protein COCC4DRAFT_150870 [Bipolaris maydis ATCC 48331]